MILGKPVLTTCLVFLIAAIMPLKALAQDDLLTSGSNGISLSSVSEVLDFDEAYILTTSFPESSPQERIVQLDWEIKPEYYLYQKKYLKIEGYVDGEAVPVEYEMPEAIVKYDELLDETVEVYFDNVSIPITFPASIENTSTQLLIRVLGCKDKVLCYPPKTKYLEIDFGGGQAELIDSIVAKQGTGANNSGNEANIEAATEPEPVSFLSLLYLLLMALVGGMILNLMPCVFPVLSIKALSFVSAKGSDHSHHVHGWVYTAGAVGSFVAMGGIIVGIRAAGGSADWGMQLQSPVFVAMMVYLFLVMGLSLSGFVHFGSNLMGIGQSLTARQGLQGSFFTGVLAVVVASPCTAPAMATALGVALTQSTPVALLIFASLGFGLALPFLILSYSPKLASYLPKPGAWMETLKQILAFPLYITAAGGLWVLGRQTSSDALTVVIVGAIAIVFAIWLWQKRPRTTFGKASQMATCAVVFIGGILLAVQAPQHGKGDYWQDYSPELVSQLRADGRPVFINLTAAWCITCHANERIALSRDEVKEAAENYNIAMIKGDYTNEDPRITELLHEYKRVGVPTYLMFTANSSNPAEILPQVLTVDTMVEAMERAASSSLVSN